MTKNRFQSKGSGAGLGNLLNRSLQFSGSTAEQPTSAESAQSLPIHSLQPNPRQPRRFFDPDSLQQLSESIRQQGVLQPLMVRLVENGQYEIVYGERRWRAAQQAGLTSVPVLIRSLSPEEVDIISAVENLQREDLNRFDEVTSKLKLVAHRFGVSIDAAIMLLKQLRSDPGSAPEQVELMEQLFSQLGREQWTSFVTNGLPALQLPVTLIGAVQSGRLDYSKAVLISRAPQRHHAELLNRVLGEELTHADLRIAIAQLKPELHTEPVLEQLKKNISVRRLSKLTEPRRLHALKLMQELNDLLK
ncbi:ParB/RepB/Spo0J family partition protein [Deinococcus sp. Arct2-2]|uniref:ParB/RepB/Spo0J family partition protein n=1 Tax=Deinococcus sp. Arct2-2 TaxID=2568653 RepID=UPI0010A33B75|nr:ParB/RepB/Spo0J family partition protein [Deinococcus sp. Arct2-2]THF71453.1 ParB/RepB/Spo0J family partition protein [Deinococcus sp. Arct2-2]